MSFAALGTPGSECSPERFMRKIAAFNIAANETQARYGSRRIPAKGSSLQKRESTATIATHSANISMKALPIRCWPKNSYVQAAFSPNWITNRSRGNIAPPIPWRLQTSQAAPAISK
jgi:hypothetical protein